MQDDTLNWLSQILKPFFVSMMSDPPHLVFTKMLPNPIAIGNSNSL